MMYTGNNLIQFFIVIYGISEPGTGTTFVIFLPIHNHDICQEGKKSGCTNPDFFELYSEKALTISEYMPE